MTVLGSRKVYMVKVGRAVNTAFVICDLPASVRKFEKIASLLSHLDTRSQKSAQVFGLAERKAQVSERKGTLGATKSSSQSVHHVIRYIDW
jgi:hypothetical protein